MEELKSRNGESGIKKDLELENWPGRKISILIRRIRKLYGVLDDQLTAKKGPYSPEENAVVDNKVTLFLKVLFQVNVINFRFVGWIKANSHVLWQKTRN